MLPGQEWDGKERREAPHHYKKNHPWRWKALGVWIGIFSLVVIWAISSVDQNSAKIDDLEKTNCNTKVFLLTAARRAEIQAEQPNTTQEERNANNNAARIYRNLANNFTAVGQCLQAKRLLEEEEGG